MSADPEKLQHLIERARALTPVRVAVVDAAQSVVLETLRDAVTLGLVEPLLLGEPDAILALCGELDWALDPAWIIPTASDAAINIAPDLAAKAEICQNAIDLFHTLGIAEPNVAVLSAVETVTGGIASTLDAAGLTLMAQRGQITGARVDGPLAFDNAISALAAKEKGILSDVAGQADILLVPDLVSGNILAKALEYLARAVAAGVAVGLSAPVVLTSRSDPAPARMASLAVAALMHHKASSDNVRQESPEGSVAAAPQPEHACCPLSVTAAIREAAE